jgi:hypothetical protein
LIGGVAARHTSRKGLDAEDDCQENAQQDHAAQDRPNALIREVPAPLGWLEVGLAWCLCCIPAIH